MGLTLVLVVAATTLLFGLVSRRLQTTIVTPPMIFVGVGLFVAAPSIGLVTVRPDDEVMRLLAEVTLALVLFTDASRMGLRPLRRNYHLPVRLLALGFPLTMVAGTIAARLLLPMLTWWEAVLLGVMLAPTDAALGQAVVASRQIPVRIRQALNVESGLNDGLAVPALLIVLPLAGATLAPDHPSGLALVARQVLLAPMIGVSVAGLGGWLAEWSTRRGWMDQIFRELSIVALALLAFGTAQALDASGFIAAFCGGLVLGQRQRLALARLYDVAEAEGQLLALITFMTVGGMLVWPILDRIDGRVLAYAVLSLTLVRLVPVAVALVGAGLSLPSTLFLGWFGPRGLASIVFALMVGEQSGVPHADELFAVAITTVLLSVVAHGVTAAPAARWYARHTEGLRPHERPEHVDVEDLPIRIRHGS